MKKVFTRNRIIIFSIIIIGLGYLGYRLYANTSGEIRYMLAEIKTGTITSSTTGSGQVSAESQVEIKSKVSGEATYVGVVSGQEVRAKDLIAKIDSRDAEISLENSRLSLQKLIKPADTSSILQSENALEDAKLSNAKAKDDLAKSYDDGFNTVSNSFLDIPDVITGLNDLLNSYQSGAGYLNDTSVRVYGNEAVNYRNDAATAYFNAKNQYDTNLIHYKNLTRASETASIESLIAETYSTSKNVADAIKNSKNAVDYIKSQQGSQSRSDSTTVQNNLNSWTSKVNGHLLNLLSIKNGIENSKNAITSSARDINQKTEALKKLRDGADHLDIKAQELAVRQKEYAYEDYFIRAQFDGVVAKLNVKKTDSVTGGMSVATIITKRKIANISLNEIDAAKIKVGQKVTLAFDAIERLEITGRVKAIDLVGVVNQGVVTYNAEIRFDAEDDRVKSGMSVNASIVTDSKQDALIVPNSAVKSQGDKHFVEIFDRKFTQTEMRQGIISKTAPQKQPVEIGISNDTSTEIISGIKEGGIIVTRVIQSALTQLQTTQQQSNGLRIPGLSGGGTRR